MTNAAIALSDALTTAALIALALAATGAIYAYLVYPALLYLVGRVAGRPLRSEQSADWPSVSITVPVYNEERTIGGTLESLLSLDYPTDRAQILVVSDASTDRTDEIVSAYADRGVELLRLPQRAGKTAVENAATHRLTGEIVVNTDASIRIPPQSLKPLIAAFSDPKVGVASGRDVSVARSEESAVAGEARYVGYEMWVRDLETRLGGIIGASGCFYAIRAELHRTSLPGTLSRDFAAPLVAREHGYRAVSIPEAICYVPRTDSLRREYRRKVRTITRGLQTLYYKKHLLNPIRHGLFAWKLFSHKICRWLLPWLLVLAAAALGVLSITTPAARWLLGGIVVVGALAGLGWLWPGDGKTPRVLSLPAFAVAGNLAAMHAAINALRGEMSPIWEPTRRQAADSR